MGRQSRCSVAGTAADDDVVHGDRAPASGRTSGETGAASFGGALVAPDGEADRHCPTVAQRCGRRRPQTVLPTTCKGATTHLPPRLVV